MFIFSFLEFKCLSSRTYLNCQNIWEFPGDPVLRTWRRHCYGPGSVPGRGTETLQATRHNQKQNATLNVFFQTIYGPTDYDTVPSENNITSPNHCHPMNNYPRVTWLMPTILNPPTTRLLETPKESLRSHRQAFFWFWWTSLDDRRVTGTPFACCLFIFLLNGILKV